MISNLKPNTVYAVHMTCPSSSGGKDWVGSATSNGELHTFWGKTGRINQHAGKKGDRFDLDKIIADKKSNGYTVIDEFNGTAWNSQMANSSPSSNQQQAKPKQPSTPVPLGPPVPILSNQDTAIAWDF